MENEAFAPFSIIFSNTCQKALLWSKRLRGSREGGGGGGGGGGGLG